MKIGSFDTADRIFIIAEIGNNHEGNFTLAEELIGLAKDAGANAVKFQTIVPEKLISSDQKDRIAQLRKYQFSYDQFKKLAKIAEQAGIIFLSTPFDPESAGFLAPIVPAFKIASSDNNFFPLLKYIAETSKPMIISAGMANHTELDKTVSFIREVNSIYSKEGLAILHCISNYPTKFEDANLLTIKYLVDTYPQITIGYSDHTLGIQAVQMACALGARIVEKHFTINKNYSSFRDHQLSADPGEFKKMVEMIRTSEILLGKYIGENEESQQEMKKNLRRSAAAKTNLNAHHIIRKEDIIWVRPGTGFTCGEEHRLFGKKLKRDIAAGEIISLTDIS